MEPQEGSWGVQGDPFQQAEASAQAPAVSRQEFACDSGTRKRDLVDGFRDGRFAGQPQIPRIQRHRRRRPCRRRPESRAFHTGIAIDPFHGGNHLGEGETEQHPLRQWT